MRGAVATALFVNAFLVFVLQPHISKRLLPVLGGSAEVWIVCSLFFQVALLAGYAVAYAIRRLPLSVSLGLHVALVAVAWWLWPFTVGDGPPLGASPPLWTLRHLIGQVGLLITALTATSPLLQYAYSRASPNLDPYPLFTASNAGSIAGLFAYPIVVEPLLTLDQQTRAWSTGAVLLLIILGVTGIGVARMSGGGVAPSLSPAPPLTMRQRLRWIVLGLVPSVLLLAVTAQITTDIAPVPLLWMVPLAVYLASFIRVFSKGWQPWRWTWPIMALISLPILALFANEVNQLWWIQVHLLVLWCGSLICHGALVQERPSSERLPEFYLLMATGGALGGWLAGIAAPLLFTMRLEYPLAVLAVLWLAPRNLGFKSPIQFTSSVGVGLTALGVLAGVFIVWNSLAPSLAGVVALVAALTAAILWHQPRRFAALTTIALVAVMIEDRLSPGNVLLRGRTFYGMHSVRDIPESGTRALFHGTTLHGAQSLRPEHRRDPLSYYGPNSPLADVFRDRVGQSQRVAALGLGAGVILRYAQPGSVWTIYEIDPAIARLAQEPTLFSHWSEAAGALELVIGDGRLRLREAPDAAYDLIIADAFASDSVPVHLLTREAMALYLSKLRHGGAVLFNISNRYLDLAPALGATAARLGLVTYHAADHIRDEASGLSPSRWLLVGNPVTLTAPTARWTLVRADVNDQGWTDDYSNVFAALRPVLAVRERISRVFRY